MRGPAVSIHSQRLSRLDLRRRLLLGDIFGRVNRVRQRYRLLPCWRSLMWGIVDSKHFHHMSGQKHLYGDIGANSPV
jgi:hypothetical protein